MSDGDDELVLEEGAEPAPGQDGDDAVSAAADDLLDGDDDGFDDEYAASDEDDEDGDDDEDEDEDEDGAEQVTVPLDAVGDDDDEQAVEPAVDIALLDGLQEDDVEVDEDDDDDEEDGLADGEFVCRSCHMAKRPSALADTDEMLCRDCV